MWHCDIWTCLGWSTGFNRRGQFARSMRSSSHNYMWMITLGYVRIQRVRQSTFRLFRIDSENSETIHAPDNTCHCVGHDCRFIGFRFIWVKERLSDNTSDGFAVHSYTDQNRYVFNQALTVPKREREPSERNQSVRNNDKYLQWNKLWLFNWPGILKLHHTTVLTDNYQDNIRTKW